MWWWLWRWCGVLFEVASPESHLEDWFTSRFDSLPALLRYRHRHRRRLHRHRRPYSPFPYKPFPSPTAPRKITTKPTPAIAITIVLAVALSGIRGLVIKPPIHNHYLALFAMPMEVGHEFLGFKAFKAAMADWSITGAHKFIFRYQKSCKARNIVVCAHAGCFF